MVGKVCTATLKLRLKPYIWDLDQNLQTTEESIKGLDCGIGKTTRQTHAWFNRARCCKQASPLLWNNLDSDPVGLGVHIGVHSIDQGVALNVAVSGGLADLQGAVLVLCVLILAWDQLLEVLNPIDVANCITNNHVRGAALNIQYRQSTAQETQANERLRQHRQHRAWSSGNSFSVFLLS